MSFTGSCHCGALRYECDGTPEEAMTCNCSICRRKGAVLYFADPERVRFTMSVEPTLYRFNTDVVAHAFCPVCGIATHARPEVPGQPPKVALNLRASDLDLATIRTWEFDGAAL